MISGYKDVSRMTCKDIDNGAAFECNIFHKDGKDTTHLESLNLSDLGEVSFDRSEPLELHPNPEYDIEFHNPTFGQPQRNIECRKDSAQQLRQETAKKWQYGALTCRHKEKFFR